MIDNFEIFKPFVHNEDSDKFFFLQILKRRKENPEMNADNIVVKSYFVSDFNALIKRKEQIIQICKATRSRAYINLNIRSYKDVSFEMLSILASRLKSKEFKSNRGLFEAACGKCNSAGKNKFWIVDLDFKDEEDISLFKKKIEFCRPEGDKIVLEVPTKNGVHLISRPFDCKQFANFKISKEYSIHKDNPSLLYLEL